MKLLRAALGLVREQWRAYLAINLVYFGLIVAAMAVVSLNREVQSSLTKNLVEGLKGGPLSPVATAYSAGHIVSAMTLTFAINFFLGSLLVITVPSLLVPFSGLAMGCLRAVLWGLIFSPGGDEITSLSLARGVLVAVLILLEGHGYTLAMFSAYVQGKSFLLPATAGVQTLAEGYWVGLKRAAVLYLLVALQLMVAAIYEASLVIVIRPLLQ